MEFKPEFDVKLEGRAKAKYIGPKDTTTLARLLDFFRAEKWRGKLEINFPGNGGVNDVVFDEVRRMTEAEANGVK